MASKGDHYAALIALLGALLAIELSLYRCENMGLDPLKPGQILKDRENERGASAPAAKD